MNTEHDTQRDTNLGLSDLWNSWPVLCLRWLVFVPIGLTAFTIMQAIPPLMAHAMKSYDPEPNLLTLALAVLVVSFAIPVVCFWFIVTALTSVLACRVIAPAPKVASVIYGMLLASVVTMAILGSLMREAGWGIVLYYIVCASAAIFGCVKAYSYEPDSVDMPSWNGPVQFVPPGGAPPCFASDEPDAIEELRIAMDSKEAPSYASRQRPAKP